MDGRGCRTPPPPILLRSDRASTLCGRCRPDTYLSIPIANRSHIANPKTMATPATKATPIHCSTPAMISVIRTMQRCLLTPPSAYSLWNQTPKRALFLLCTLFSAGARRAGPAAPRRRPGRGRGSLTVAAAGKAAAGSGRGIPRRTGTACAVAWAGCVCYIQLGPWRHESRCPALHPVCQACDRYSPPPLFFEARPFRAPRTRVS